MSMLIIVKHNFYSINLMCSREINKLQMLRQLTIPSTFLQPLKKTSE